MRRTNFGRHHRKISPQLLLPALSALVRLDAVLALLMALACALALLLSYRTRRFQAELAAYRRLRDDVQETSRALEEKNRGLRDKQDLEVRLATLAERGRRVVHLHLPDNSGVTLRQLAEVISDILETMTVPTA